MKVMSYNIHQYNQEMSKAADLIARQNPDILLIQEIEPPNFKTDGYTGRKAVRVATLCL